MLQNHFTFGARLPILFRNRLFRHVSTVFQAKIFSIDLGPRVVSRFENTVVAQFYGHTHQDEFIVFYEPEASARATNIAFISPSVATWTNLNPSYRIFTSDSNTHVRHHSFLSLDSSLGIFSYFEFLPYK